MCWNFGTTNSSEDQIEYKRGGTASMIVSSVCREHRNSDLRADDPDIMRAFNEHFKELEAQRDEWRRNYERLNGLVRESLKKARTETAQKCFDIAMERCRTLNRDAVAQIRTGWPERASITELKADQCEWVANAILREFGL